MEKLLQWGLANSDPDALARQANGEEPRQSLKDLDPGVIDAILGKDDATLMKESMLVILSKEAELEDKLAAFDNLEMLVEQIDNAKNLEPLKLWEPLLALLSDEEVSLRKYSAWVIGTATQNNPVAQDNFLDHKGLEILLEAFRNESVNENSKKLAYSLSCSIRHHPRALDKFQQLGGYKLIAEKIQGSDCDISVKTRLFFMFNSLINDDSSIISYLADVGIFQHLVELICDVSNQSDADFIEKSLMLLSIAAPTLAQKQSLPKFDSLHDHISSLKVNHAAALSTKEWNMLLATL
ncbi:hsp70 nucleotide exchange factor fes1 [Entomophthora muscae]|uniref:Hsp70 nucleotide exchange factor fes1 n=1 Tax=Entomophthora muscae TaxID=34485 RepID=A0ACC2T2J1_9FUNG|nr:hsp70 nucleotide exchange factor fes1 [Entomophthora muscae]